MSNDYNRNYPHNKTQMRCKVNQKEAEVLLALFENRTHRQLARFYYVEGYTLEKCADLMMYSKRQTERMKSEIDKIALYSLLNIVTSSVNAFKLLQIKKILMGETQPNDVKCIDCEHLELSLPYGVCSKGYKGMVDPNDSCGKGKLKETVGDNNESQT